MDKKLKSFEEFFEEKEKNERILQEGRKRGYNVFKANEETVRICRENEKKKPVPIPDDSLAYFNKILKIND